MLLILLRVEIGGTAFEKAAAPILTEKFRPIVNQSLGQVNATKYWTDATSIYNKIPMVKPCKY